MARGVLDRAVPAKPDGQQQRTTTESDMEIERKEQSNSVEELMENGAGTPTLEQGMFTEEDAKMELMTQKLKQADKGTRNYYLCCKKYTVKRNKSKFHKKVVVLLVLVLVVSLFCNVYQYVKSSPAAPGPCSATSCPQGWKQNEDRCYFFSETEGTWNFSQSSCSSFGGSLVTMDSQPELDYIMRSKLHEYCWIGLQREDVGHPWKLPNGSLFSDRFPIKGEGFCAYLSENAFSSTWCSNKQYWICSKPLHVLSAE